MFPNRQLLDSALASTVTVRSTTNAYAETNIRALVDIREEADTMTGEPMRIMSSDALVAIADVPGIAVDDHLLHDGIRYRITSIIPDGNGCALLKLSEV